MENRFKRHSFIKHNNKKKILNEVHVHCGRIYTPSLPTHLSNTDPPIPLTSVEIRSLKKIKNPIVKINYSCVIPLTQRRRIKRFKFIFRLVRKEKNKNPVNLNEWELSQLFIEVLNLNEYVRVPFVIQYCDESHTFNDTKVIYEIQLAEVSLRNASYKIIDKGFSALVSSNVNHF
ncbi:DUF4489 domain-containing protein [Marininema halotolerans]|uniref:Uncharacterized protein n=1 Tax=Marininema halotolerans TaxID=1155944 RepID=A0A1I6R7C5_9BACL|nr:DUF4489 domain-containing protein [Marininema halotolerans]SFS60480.1 protein of unknown function [Marininema halotolerans]